MMVRRAVQFPVHPKMDFCREFRGHFLGANVGQSANKRASLIEIGRRVRPLMAARQPKLPDQPKSPEEDGDDDDDDGDDDEALLMRN